ncbi:MAG: hypothetical protein MZV63_20845 [Marinilabiliales bacterium]|nr:hypothetical protein [Marinilabiliales bacterium]
MTRKENTRDQCRDCFRQRTDVHPQRRRISYGQRQKPIDRQVDSAGQLTEGLLPQE